MTYASNTLGFADSDTAHFRLHCIEVYEQTGWEGLSIAFPLLKRRTFFHWRATYLASGKKLTSLVPRSTRPKRVRSRMVDPKILAFIRSLREAYPRLGKAKLVGFVVAFCTQEGLVPIGETTIGEVIRDHHLFYAGKPAKRRQSRTRPYLKTTPKATSLAPGYVQLDGVRVYAIDRYYLFLTAIDIVTKQAWVSLVPTFSSKHTTLFLQEVLQSAFYAVHTIQTDNGSEFAGSFEVAVHETALQYLHSYPKHPKANAYVERFNWTFQDEFLANCDAFLSQQTDQLPQAVTTWLYFYHHTRPHQSLAYKTPYQYAVERQRVP